MENYELLIIISPEAEKDEESAAVGRIITELKGEIKATEDWGRKKLSHPINGQTAGSYLLFNLKLPTQNTAKLKEELRIREGLLRFMLTKKEVTT